MRPSVWVVGIALMPVACGSSSPNEGTDAGVDAPLPVDAKVDAITASDAPSDATSSSGAWVMGYYPSWDSPANGGSYAVSAIDWDGLTHVAAAFYVPDGKGGWESGYFDDATASSLIGAAHGQGKKAIASIGGADSGPGFEGSMQRAYQSTFLASLAALVTLGYDGLDIDWEGGNLSVTQDQALETTLIDALRPEARTSFITLTAGYENENSARRSLLLRRPSPAARSHQPDDLRHVGRVAGLAELALVAAALEQEHLDRRPASTPASPTTSPRASLPRSSASAADSTASATRRPSPRRSQALGRLAGRRERRHDVLPAIMNSYYSSERVPLRLARRRCRT